MLESAGKEVGSDSSITPTIARPLGGKDNNLTDRG
jgi:hypothetical protein